MGRSSKSQADENRARIVGVATDLFSEHGVEAVSIADVMVAAGMTQGGFYKHFSSKDALAAEACAHAFARASKAWREKVAQAKGRDEPGLPGLISYYFTPKPPKWTCPMVGLGQDAAAQASGTPLHGAYAEGVSGLLEAFEDAVGTTEGSAVSRDRELLLFAAMVGANFLCRAIGNEPRIEEMKRIVLGEADRSAESQPSAD